MEVLENGTDVQMTLLESAEIYGDADEEPRYTDTLVICQHEEDIYHARMKARGLKSNITPIQDMIDIIRIPKEAYSQSPTNARGCFKDGQSSRSTNR